MTGKKAVIPAEAGIHTRANRMKTCDYSPNGQLVDSASSLPAGRQVRNDREMVRPKGRFFKRPYGCEICFADRFSDKPHPSAGEGLQLLAEIGVSDR